MYERETYPIAYSEKAVTGLQRHGFPWGALLSQVYNDTVIPYPDDPYVNQISNFSREKLKEVFKSLEKEAAQLVGKIAANSRDTDNSAHEEQIQISTMVLSSNSENLLAQSEKAQVGS